METVPSAADAIKLAQFGDTDRLREMLNLYPQLLQTAKDWSGDGLLATACWHCKYDTVLMLVERGAELNAQNNVGSTPLHRACHKNDVRIATLLINQGADYNIRDKSGRLPADVGDMQIKEMIWDYNRMKNEEMQQHEIEEKKRLAMEAMLIANAQMEVIRKRLQHAVPISISGAVSARYNGIYEPTDEVHNDWPVYSKRGDRDLWLVMVNNEWLLQSTANKGSSKAFMRLLCDPLPCFPELRTNGSNGIVESAEFLGVVLSPLLMQHRAQRSSRVIVTTEEQEVAHRASLMHKLAAEVEQEEHTRQRGVSVEMTTEPVPEDEKNSFRSRLKRSLSLY